MVSKMKKSLLALALCAATALTTTASAVTVYDKDGTSLDVYGRVQAVWYNNYSSSTSNDSNSIEASGRLGLDLRTQLTPGIAGFAKAEWEEANGNNKVDTEDGFSARYMWVGVDFGQFGQIKAGKFEDALKYAISPTDKFDDFGCVGVLGNDDRREGLIQYQWSGFGVDAIVSYAFAKDNEHFDGAYFSDEIVDIDYSWAAALGYTSPDVLFGPIAIRVAYSGGDFAENYQTYTDGTTDNNVTGYGNYDSYDQYAVSLSWGYDKIGPYVATMYQCRSFDMLSGSDGINHDYDVSGFEFIAGYTFTNGIGVLVGYEYQNLDVDNTSVDVDAYTIPVYVNWQINPQFNIWAEARFDAGSDDGDNATNNFDLAANGCTNFTENVFSLGARFTF